MDILMFTQQLHDNLDKECLEVAEVEKDDFRRASRKEAAARDCVSSLKRFVQDYEFRNTEEEVKFFKTFKPALVSELFFYQKVAHLKLETGRMNERNREQAMIKSLRMMNRFTQLNYEFYQYYITGQTHLDEIYFRRGNRFVQGTEADEKFSTGYDTLLAELLAVDKVLEYMSRTANENILLTTQAKALTWTGSKTSLIELVYALQSVGIFNNASVDVRHIASSFEKLFQIELGNFYKIYQEIRMRKKNTTQFLDQMKECLQKRINEFDQ